MTVNKKKSHLLENCNRSVLESNKTAIVLEPSQYLYTIISRYREAWLLTRSIWISFIKECLIETGIVSLKNVMKIGLVFLYKTIKMCKVHKVNSCRQQKQSLHLSQLKWAKKMSPQHLYWSLNFAKTIISFMILLDNQQLIWNPL